MNKKNYDRTDAARELKELYDKAFIAGIENCGSEWGEIAYGNRFFGGIWTELIAFRLQGGIEAMTGPRRGLTTRIPEEAGRRAGEEAILLLKFTYCLEEELIPELRKVVWKKFEESRMNQEEEQELLEEMRRRDKMRKENCERLSGEDCMIHRKYLEDVCDKTCQYFQEHDCLPELEDLYSDEAWKTRFKYSLSVVKYAAWKLMESHLGLGEE